MSYVNPVFHKNLHKQQSHFIKIIADFIYDIETKGSKFNKFNVIHRILLYHYLPKVSTTTKQSQSPTLFYNLNHILLLYQQSPDAFSYSSTTVAHTICRPPPDSCLSAPESSIRCIHNFSMKKPSHFSYTKKSVPYSVT